MNSNGLILSLYKTALLSYNTHNEESKGREQRAHQLEFKDNWDHMQFIRNHTLNTKPLEIDMLIIELEKGISTKNEIGEFFRKSNPRALFKYLEEHGFQVTEMHHGIYRVEGAMLFPTQIIVGRELDPDQHKLLGVISDNVSKQTIRNAFIYRESVTDKREMDLWDSVLDLCMRLNKKSVAKLKEEDQKMNQALMELMEPEIREAERKTAQRVERETKTADIKLLVKNMRRFHAGDDDIQATLMEDYGLSEEEALSYI